MNQSEAVRILIEFLSYPGFKIESNGSGFIYSYGEYKYNSCHLSVEEGLWEAVNYFRARRIAGNMLIEMLDKERYKISKTT